MQNCTFYDGLFVAYRLSWQPLVFWKVENTSFDGTGFYMVDDLNGTNSETLINYNAYNTNNLSGLAYSYPYGATTNVMEVVGPNDKTISGYNWQNSWFGGFYIPTNSPLIEAGSTNANLLGLYYFTTQTNQVVEGDATVDIGYHYVATDAMGNPLVTFGDNIPDYLDDPNGNGLPNWWELKYFGNTSESAANLDITGHTLLFDFENGRDPTQTMVVGIGTNVIGQCNVPFGLTNAVQVAAGQGQGLALKTDGTVVAWGNGYGGQGTVPTNLTGVAMIAAGYDHDVALLTNGTVTAWGLSIPGTGYNLTNVPVNLTNATL